MSHESGSNRLEVPKASLGDRAHAIVRAALGAIPVGGQAAIELFNALIMPPLVRRRDEWMHSVGESLARLAEDGRLKLEELQKNETFIDLLVEATLAAMRTADQEKRDALRNAIRNAAVGHAPEETLQHMFIRWADELTPWHLRLLKFFQDPKAWATRHNHVFPLGGILKRLSDVVENAYPELKGKGPFYDALWRDLYQRGLVNTDALHTVRSGLLTSRLSEIGEQFLRFIDEGE